MKSKRSLSLRARILALTLIIVAPLACSDGAQPAADAPQPLAVRVAAPSTRDLTVHARYVGTLSHERTITVRAQIPGTIDELHGEQGDYIEAGAVLVNIAAPETRARIDQIQAEIRRAEAESEFACSKRDTDQKLANSGALETIQLDASRKNCAAAEQAVRGTKARRAELRTAQRRTVERAPVDGRLVQWMVEAGEYVGPGQPLAVLGTRDQIVAVDVAEPDMARGVAPGLPVALTIGDVTRRAEVIRALPWRVGPARATPIEIVFGGSSELPAGSSVGVDFLFSEARGVLAVPERAIIGDDQPALFTANDGVAKRQNVELGLRAGGWVEVVSGLSSDQQVITTSVSALVDGDAIYPVEVSR